MGVTLLKDAGKSRGYKTKYAAKLPNNANKLSDKHGPGKIPRQEPRDSFIPCEAGDSSDECTGVNFDAWKDESVGDGRGDGLESVLNPMALEE